MHNGESVVDDSAKADISDHLHSVFTQEDLSRLDSLKHSLKYRPTVISSVNFYHLLCTEIYKASMCARPVVQILF